MKKKHLVLALVMHRPFRDEEEESEWYWFPTLPFILAYIILLWFVNCLMVLVAGEQCVNFYLLSMNLAVSSVLNGHVYTCRGLCIALW